jgi:hypothetical protein
MFVYMNFITTLKTFLLPEPYMYRACQKVNSSCIHVVWSGDNTHIMVTANSAPRVDILVEYASLFKAYFEVVENTKFPPKFHNESLSQEHMTHGPLFPSTVSRRDHVDLWAGHIRNAALKYRDLKMHSTKLAIVERAA